jgi:hypothetical protein
MAALVLLVNSVAGMAVAVEVTGAVRRRELRRGVPPAITYSTIA